MSTVSVNNSGRAGDNGEGSLLSWAATDYANTTSARYLPVGSSGVTASGIEDNSKQVIAAASGTLKNLLVNSDALGGVNATFTVRVNMVDTGITCTIAGGATSASDLIHTASVVQGDVISLKTVTSSASASTVGPSAVLEVGN